MLIEKEELKPYERITDAQRKIREGGDFIDEVLDRFLNGTHMSGIKLPFPLFDSVFRLREQEITILGGINGAGKSLFASQIMLNAIEQGYPCMSVSLEMSGPQQVSRKIRQCSLQARPEMESVLSFAQWCKGKLYFYDQHGSVDPKTLGSVIRYAVDKFKVKFVLVDSLMTMSMASDDWNGQKAVVNMLANAARGLDIHIMLVCHARKGQDVKTRLDKWSIAGSADITNRADNVIILGREYEKDGADAYMSLCKARHWDGAEMDLDLCFDMASLNFYMHDLPPTQIGMNEKVRPNGGVVGELETMHLND